MAAKNFRADKELWRNAGRRICQSLFYVHLLCLFKAGLVWAVIQYWEVEWLSSLKYICGVVFVALVTQSAVCVCLFWWQHPLTVRGCVARLRRKSSTVPAEAAKAARERTNEDLPLSKINPRLRIAIVGAGGIGNPVGVQIAPVLGRAEVTISEPDLVEPSNYYRWMGVPQDKVDHKKSEVLAELMHRANPLLTIQTQDLYITQKRERKVADFLRDKDAVIIAVDDMEALDVLNRVCWTLDKPAVFGACHGDDRGSVVYSIPGVTSCLRCALNLIEFREEEQIAAAPISGLDFLSMANHTAKVFVEVLVALSTQKWPERTFREGENFIQVFQRCESSLHPRTHADQRSSFSDCFCNQ